MTAINYSYYLQIDTLPILLLVILCINAKRNFRNLKNSDRFVSVCLMIILILVTDLLSWYFIGEGDRFSPMCLWNLGTIYYMLDGAIGWAWFGYAYYQVHGDFLTDKEQRVLTIATIPIVLYIAIVIGTPMTHWIFYVDEKSRFFRGNLHVIQSIVGLGYLVASGVMPALRYKKEELFERKVMCQGLALAAILPFVGAVIQLLNYNLILLWPFSTISMFIMYISFQRTKISVDPLTGLNNRGRLETYLQYKVHTVNDDWFLMFIDIDHFKKINDTFGHTTGDRALQMVAEAMRATLGTDSDCMLSRYGGDEFAIVLNHKNEMDMKEVVRQLRTSLSNLNDMSDELFKLQLSIGYARWNHNKMKTVEDILKVADTEMYLQKLKTRIV